MKDFTELTVWRRAHNLTLEIYSATGTLPSEERYGLTSQIRRSAVSVPSNIAEGCGRPGDPEFRRFLGIALGSAGELDYQLLLAKDLPYLTPEEYPRLQKQVDDVQRMLSTLYNKL